jgi:hypothetical protein
MRSTPPSAAIPPLPAQIAGECRVPEETDGSLGDLARKLAALAADYHRCREKHRAAVEAYERVRRALAPDGQDEIE